MYCIIPYKLIKDKSVSSSAKLLYAIMAQESKNLECEKTNRELADIFKVTRHTICIWLRQLEQSKYIQRTSYTGYDQCGNSCYIRSININS